MADLKQLALSAADDAFSTSIKTMATNLLNSLVTAKSEEERADAITRQKTGLRLAGDAHAATIAAVGEIYG